MDEKDQTGNGDENLAVGDTPSGNPPFLIYKRRLYVLSKKPPALRRNPEAHNALVVQARPGQRGRAIPGRPLRRTVRHRTRPFVKGTYRVYSSRFPHLAPADRRKPRRRLPRTSE